MTSEWSNQPTNKHRRQGGGKFRPVTPATRDQQLFIPPLTVLNIVSSIKIVWISSSALVNVLYSTLQDRIWCDRVERILRERKSTPFFIFISFLLLPPFFLVQRIGGYWTGRTERKFRSVDGGNILLDTLASEAKQQQQQKLDIYIYLPPIDGHKKTSLLFLLCLSLFVPLFFCSKIFFFLLFTTVASRCHVSYRPLFSTPKLRTVDDETLVFSIRRRLRRQRQLLVQATRSGKSSHWSLPLLCPDDLWTKAHLRAKSSSWLYAAESSRVES